MVIAENYIKCLVYISNEVVLHMIIDSKRESLEFKPPSLPEAVERTYRERRLSSISYSTFISEQRPKSLKSKPPDGVASPVELPSERSKEYSGSSTTSESFNIQTNAAFEQKVLGAPHSLGWDEESLTANFHGPCDSDEQSTEDSSGYDNYDLPRKLAPQSRSIPQTGVGASYLGPTHMPDRKDTISTGPVIPHVVSSNQYAIGGVTVCPSAAKHVNEEPISLRELGHVSVPTGSDTTYVYDIPPSRVSNRPTARHPQRVQLPLIHSPLPSSCELNISESRLTRRTTSPAKSMSESRCSSDTKPPANLSLTDLIKNHPLLKDKSEEDQNRSVEETLEIPKGCSSFLPLIPRSNNQETSVEHQQLTLTTSTSKVGITMSDPSNCHEDQISLETLDDTQTQTNSISVQLGADKSQSPVKQTQQSKQNSSTCSFREGPATVYSQVVNASMNRAQTLKVRNIQELKKLDCQKVKF